MSGVDTSSYVLVELDALLDTRLGALTQVAPAAAARLVTDRRYFTRQIDAFEWEDLDWAAFRRIYQARDAEAIFDSVMTEMTALLPSILKKLVRVSETTPYLPGLAVELNVYPYQLDAFWREEIHKNVREYIPPDLDLRVVYYPPEQLTPAFLRGRYSGMIIYDFARWFEVQMRAFETVKLPRFTILAPALYQKAIPAPEDIYAPDMIRKLTPFEIAETGLADCFQLELLEAHVFSIIRPDVVLPALERVALKQLHDVTAASRQALAEQREDAERHNAPS
jgi:hypothetical protein